MPTTLILILLSAVFYVSAVSRNEATVLQLLPGAKIRVVEGTKLVVNCTSHSDETPKEMQWNASRVNKHMTSEKLDNRTVALVIDNLHRSDAGFYTCYLFLPKGRKFEKTVHVSVAASHSTGNMRPCASTEFRCKNRLCIFLQFHCDNINDCGDNSDEEDCGDDKCDNKFKCRNKRCISHDRVCDEFHSDDCGDMTDEMCRLTDVALEDFLPSHSVATSHPRQTSVDDQMRWLKTTVYSVIGCTVGVVLFIAILVIAIFRIKMKRAAARRQMFFIERRRREVFGSHPNCGRYPEMDPFLSSRRVLSSHSNIILNVNNGVQYVPGLGFTSLMEAPPPYSDSVTEASPARGDSPPPPYSTIDRRTSSQNRGQEGSRGNNSDTDSSQVLTDQAVSQSQLTCQTLELSSCSERAGELPSLNSVTATGQGTDCESPEGCAAGVDPSLSETPATEHPTEVLTMPKMPPPS